MYVCYLDEAGNGQTLEQSAPDAPPVFVLGGLTVHDRHIKGLVWDFLELKKKHRPMLRSVELLSEVIRTEIKGSDVRKDLRSTKRNAVRGAIGLLDSLTVILRERDARILARVWVKEEGKPFDEERVYGSSVSALTESFQAQLAHEHSRGQMILDNRTKWKNTPLVHAVTTQRYRTGGDAYRGLIESPTFGHSDTHTLLQLADLVVSSLLFPIACHSYLADLTWNVHCDGAYAPLRERFGPQLKDMQFRYQDPTRRWRGGIVVSDRRTAQSSSLMFGPPRTPESPRLFLPGQPSQATIPST